MPEFKRIRKKNAEILDVDRSGITRIKGGWLIRLGWENRRPKFQKVIRDNEYSGNHIESYLEAASIAKELRPNYKTSFKQPTNLIKGLCLAKQKSKTKGPEGQPQFYYSWKFSYVETNKQKGRTFGFWKTGLIYEAFLAAIGFAARRDSELDIGIIDEHFLQYIKDVDADEFKTFLLNSDFKILDSETDMIILKNRYLSSTHQSRPFKQDY